MLQVKANAKGLEHLRFVPHLLIEVQRSRTVAEKLIGIL
jgi:hypothetical protein